MSRYHDSGGADDYGSAGYDAEADGRRGTAQYRPSDDSGARGQRRRARSGSAGGPSRSRSGRASGGSKSGGSRFGQRPILSVLAIIATVAVTGITLTAYAAYRNVYDSINHVDVTNGELGKRPLKLNGSLNVLMIGTDSRVGSHGKYGTGIDGSRSDTMMLLHISPAHDHVFVISFPRDSMVPEYRCAAEDKSHPGQTAEPGSLERLNSTFSNGGAPCLWYTLEQQTHIHIDHFMEVDFSGFKKIVNDLHGVSVCLPFAINDPASRLHLPKGRQVIGGAQALAFVRERHIGFGSDLQRIQRQQLFLASVAQKIKSTGALTNPTQMYSMVHDMASSLTTDSGLSLTGLLSIANSLKSLSTTSLRFISVPPIPYPPAPLAEVEWAQPASDQLFKAIAKDSGIAKAAKDHPTPGPTVSPSHVQLQVLNGTQVAGLAGSTAQKLKASGFSVTGTANANSDNYAASVILFTSASQLPEVNTLKNALAGVETRQVKTLPGGASVALVIGSSFKGMAGAHPAKAHKKSAPPVSTLGNNYGGIAGSTNICRDAGAFSGPDNPQDFTP
jgi:LCP family protein required for cell wall assembly